MAPVPWLKTLLERAGSADLARTIAGGAAELKSRLGVSDSCMYVRGMVTVAIKKILVQTFGGLVCRSLFRSGGGLVGHGRDVFLF